MCLDEYAGLTETEPCASGTRIDLQHNIDAMRVFDEWLDEPARDLLRNAYVDMLLWAYLSEQFSIARSLTSPNPAHPFYRGTSLAPTTDSLIAVGPAELAKSLGDADRRPDEGHDIRARVAETFQGFYDIPTAIMLDVALRQHLGRSLGGVMTDLASSLVLKDYLSIANPQDDARFVWQWLGRHNADATQDYFPENPGNGVLTLEQRKLNHLPGSQFEGMLTLTPAILNGAIHSMSDFMHRVHREHDTWQAVSGVNELFFSRSDVASGTKILERHGAMVISARPQADPTEDWPLRIRVTGQFNPDVTPVRMRLFRIDSAGKPWFYHTCRKQPEGGAPSPVDLCQPKEITLQGQTQHGFEETIRIKAGSTSIRELIAVVSSPTGAQLDWEISEGDFNVSLGPATDPGGIGPGPGSPSKSPASFDLHALAHDGSPLLLDKSDFIFSFPGCYEESSGPGVEPCAVAGTDERVQLSTMADGRHRVAVTLPDSFYPPVGVPLPARIGLRVEAAGLRVAERADAFVMDSAPPRTAVVLAIDEGDAMAEPERLAGAKVAAELVLRSLRDEDAAAVVTFGRDAYTLQGLGSFCDALSDEREAAIEALESLDPLGCASLGDGLLEAQSVLASALDDPRAEGSLAECLPERQLVVVLSAQPSEAGSPGYAYYAPLDGESPTTDGTEAYPSCGPDDDPGDNEAWYAGELRRPQRAALGLPVPTIAAVAVEGGPEADELHTLVHAAGGRSSFGSAGAGRGRAVPAALLLADAARAQVGAVMGYQRVASFYADSPLPTDMPWLDVEAGAGELLVSVASADSNVGGLMLVSPTGLHHPPANAGPRAVVFRVAQPDAGGWSFAHDEPLPEPPLREGPTVFVEQAVVSAVQMVASADSVGRRPLSEPRGVYETGRYAGAPVALRAIVTGNGPLAGADVYAVITSPLGVTSRLSLYDDGQHGDGGADDGVYAATHGDTNAPGAYQVRFSAYGASELTNGAFTREQAVAFAVHEGADTDLDGLPDWWEQLHGRGLEDLDPEDDTDHDGLDNLTEFAFHTNPRLSDTDGGGESDGSEVTRGTNPLSAGDDRTYVRDSMVAPGNEKSLVALSVPLLIDAYVEVESGPSADGPFEVVYAGDLPEDGIIANPTENDVTVCYRTRTTLGDVVSGWSTAECVLPRLDPYAPKVGLEVPAPPAPGNTHAVVRIAASDSPSGASPLAIHPLPTLSDPDAERSGVTEMLVWTDQSEEASWQPLQHEVTVAIVDPDFTPVYAKVRDAAGNESGVAEVVVFVRDPWPREAVVAYDRVELEPHAVIDGSVAVVNDDEAPLPGGAELVLGAHAQVQGPARASGVILGQDSLVAGSLAYDEVEGLGLVGGELLSPLATPVPLRVPAMPTIATDGPSVSVSKNQVMVLDPGSYGAVALQSGNPSKRAVLTLSGGTYGMGSLTLGNRARVQCASTCTVLIAEELVAHHDAEIAPASSDILDAQVGFFVARTDDGSDPSVRLGPQANIHGRVISPSGTIWLKQGTTATATLFGKRVRVGPNATVTKDGR